MTHKPRPKRRVMTAFKINEISVCDVPAQEGATMTLLKRRDPAPHRKELPTMTDLQKRAAEIAERDGLSRTEAMRKARLSMSAEQFEAQRFSKAEPVANVAPLRKREGVLDFEKAVDEIVATTGMSRTEAMSKARTTRPDLLAALRGGGDLPDAA